MHHADGMPDRLGQDPTVTVGGLLLRPLIVGCDADKRRTLPHSWGPGNSAYGPESHHLIGSCDPLGPSVQHDAPALVALLVELVDLEGNLGGLA